MNSCSVWFGRTVPMKLNTSTCPFPAVATAFFASSCHTGATSDGTPNELVIESGSVYVASAIRGFFNSSNVRSPSGCIASTFGNGWQGKVSLRTVLYTQISNPFSKAALQNLLFKSGPAGIPNGVYTLYPKKSTFGSSRCTYAFPSAKAPKGPEL